MVKMSSWVQHLLLYLIVIFLNSSRIQAGRIYYVKCEYMGFSCVKSKIPGKHDITFTCNHLTTRDIELYLWQFRAPTTINSLHITNCSSVKLNLVCTNEGRAIQQLRLSNISNLSITPLQHGLPQLPPEFILEDIYLANIPSRTFLQTKKFPFSKYGCANLKDLDSVGFKNVKIGTIEREAFHSLADVKNFSFENVSVERIEAIGIQVFMGKNTTFKISFSSFGVLEYMSFFIRGYNFEISSTAIHEMHSSSINATIFDFNFHNNSVGYMHPQSMSILAQNIKIMDSSFDYLASSAFQGLGPGLPENSLRSFGHLKFVYEFRNNLIESLEVGSLHSDWKAYKNVGSVVTFSYNAIKCTCAELAWLGSKEGFGKEFSNLKEFHEIVLDRENNNICVDAPCILPLGSVELMIIKNGKCMHNITQEYMCSTFYPPSTTTIKSITLKSRISTNKNHNPVLYQRLTISNANNDYNKNKLIFITMTFIVLFYL